MLYLKMILRSWRRAWMSSIISIVSLVVGLTCSTLLLLFVMSEYRIARSLGDTSDVFQLEMDDSYYTDGSVRSGSIHPRMSTEFADRYSQIESLAKVIELRTTLISEEGVSTNITDTYIVSPEFAELFDIGVVAGDLSSTLSARNEVAVTDKFMQQYFGRPARLGETIKISSGGNVWINDVQVPPVVRELTITTILADPGKTPFTYNVLTTFNGTSVNENDIDNYGGENPLAFVKLKDANVGEELEALINADSTRSWAEMKIYLRPFDQVYLNGAVQSQWSSTFIQRRDPTMLSIGLTVALLVLVISVFNYVNITMTRARGRLRNLASQRIFGASKWAVRLQTVLDTLLMVLLSFAISLFIINALIPSFNSFMNSYIALSDIFIGSTGLMVLMLLVSVLTFSSIYILAKINTSNMIETLKNPMGRGIKVSSVMVVAQFVISIALVAVSMNISRQLTYISTSLPTLSSVIQIQPSDQNEISRDFIDHISSLPWVKGYSSYNVKKGSSMAADGHSLNGMSGGNSILDFYGLHLIEGRRFEASDSSNSVIINEAAIREFGLTSPVVGQDLEFSQGYRIVGVVEDFMYEDAHKQIQALIIQISDYSKNRKEFPVLYIKVAGNVEERMDDIQAIWREEYPAYSGLAIKTMPQIIREEHASDERMRTMVSVMMVVSMILTAIGLFGLAFYTVARRTREIAIRKVHGSTSMQVVLLLCRTFTLWVGVAVVIALPLAYFVSDWWLSGFVYHVNIEWWVFALTIVLVSVVAFVTVIFQTLSAARANPANSIKAE